MLKMCVFIFGVLVLLLQLHFVCNADHIFNGIYLYHIKQASLLMAMFGTKPAKKKSKEIQK